MSQRTTGNPANGTVGDPVRNAIFRSPAQLASYKGVHGQIGFLLCAGNMRGVVFDGKTCGGVAHWPLFAAGTDFSNLYGIVDGCVDIEALTANCPPVVVVNPAICAAKQGAEIIATSQSMSWDGNIYGDASLTMVVTSGQLIVTDSAGVNHVLLDDGTPATPVAIGSTTGVAFTGSYTITDADGNVAECTVENKPLSAGVNVPA